MAWGDSLLSTNYGDIKLSGRLPVGGVIKQDAASGAGASDAWGGLAIGLLAARGINEAFATYDAYSNKAGSLRATSANLQGNAEMSELAAQQAQRAGQAAIARLTMRSAQIKAKQRAGFAANGIAGNVGSAAEALASTDAMTEVDKQTIQMNALQQSWGYRRQAVALNAQSKAAEIMADANDSAARLGMFGSLIGSASRVAGAYYFKGAQ